MEFNALLQILASVTAIAMTCNGALTPEQYWKSALPSIQIPNAIKDILQLPDYVKANSSFVMVGRDNSPQLYAYDWGGREGQAPNDLKVTVFFLEKDLKPGTTMSFPFTGNPSPAGFLRREVAKSIPFSSKDLPYILSRFSVKPGSVEAKVLENTIKLCAEVGMKGEEKYCATSLESMIDNTKSMLGNSINVASTEVKRENPMQKFTIKGGVRRICTADASSVACHKQSYPYAVYYCHITTGTRLYMVPMRSADGTEVRAVTTCHANTSTWNPKHAAFQVLKVKPGTVPVCHFLQADDIVWFHN